MAAGSTIAAIATPPGPARRGIVRVSGPLAAELVRATLREDRPRFESERARWLARGRFDDGRGLQPVTLLWMRGPRSFTREDVAEFHLCGAEPLLACALARLLALGATAARPGEFTLRAFRNGRLDLSRAEGVLALTEAGNESERAAAALLLDGGLDQRSAAIREHLLALATACEASLDFEESETGHVPRAELVELWRRADAALSAALEWELRRAAPNALARVLLVGLPNAGKSSLWNALTGGRALISPSPGTTRDTLEGTWKLGAETCLLIDGPGLEALRGGPAGRAQELFARVRGQVDLALWVVDAAAPVLTPVPEGVRLLVWNKTDLRAAEARPDPAQLPCGLAVVAVSAQSGAGLGELASAVERRLGPADESGGAARALFARHREALIRARAALGEVGEGFASGLPLDLCAEALRAALAALDELSGRSTPEDVLERIFARFCLGK